MSLHLYGVVRADTELPEMDGVGDPPGGLRLVEVNGIAAIVSEADEDTLTEQDAVKHLDVLAGVAASLPVLPLRFGTVAPDEAAVRDEVLTPKAQDFQSQLSALESDVELRLDLTFDEEEALRQVLGARPEIANRADGAGYDERIEIGEAIAAELQIWTQQQGEQAITPLAAIAKRHVRLPATAPNVDRWAFLVPRDRVADVDEMVNQLRIGVAAEVQYVGPLPPYSFLEEAAPPATSRWGW
ncbi:MAG: GvpL/GvpF family gas vesicle protein [Micromonosporaceae bacterium]